MSNDSPTRTDPSPPAPSSGEDGTSSKAVRYTLIGTIVAALITAIATVAVPLIQQGDGQSDDGSGSNAGGRRGPEGARPSTASTTFGAEIRWTDDQGGTSISTTLKAFVSPTSHTSMETYNLGDQVRVTCATDGRTVPVGPAYRGPNANSSVWYRLDTGSYVTAVYTAVDEAASPPRCAGD